MTSTRLRLILLPTEACNLRCVYCYERFEPKRMGRDVAQSIVNLIQARAPELSDLTITWFGGEPLLALDTIRFVMAEASRIIRFSPVGNPRFSSDISTNGIRLNLPTMTELVTLGVREYQITLDGSRDEHDRLRVTRKGRGTFDDVYANIVAAHRSALPFAMLVRIHSNARNEASIQRLLADLSRELAGDVRFRVFIRKLSRWGGPNDDILPTSDDTEAVARLRRLANELGLKNYTVDLSQPCYAAELNSFVIRSDGRVGKCTHALYDSRNDVGRINSDGKLMFDTERLFQWTSGLFSGSTAAVQCPLSQLSKGPSGLSEHSG